MAITTLDNRTIQLNKQNLAEIILEVRLDNVDDYNFEMVLNYLASLDYPALAF